MPPNPPLPAPPSDDPNVRLRRSFLAVIRDPEAFGELFYQRLFELAPPVRAMFPDDMKSQQQKLVHAIAVLVRGLDQPQAMEPVLRLLGARHVGYGVHAHQYVVVGEALIDTLDRVGDAPLDDATRQAWTQLYGWVAATMLAGAEEVLRTPPRRSAAA